MKKLVSLLVVSVFLLSLCSCGEQKVPEPTVESGAVTVTPSPEAEQSETVTPTFDYEIGDEVSVTGQKANSTLVNDNTIWVQVVKQGERTVVYHCQLKDEYVEQGGNLKMLDVVEIKGCFMSVSDMAGATETATEENTAIIVTLYDCEIL